MNVSHHFAFFIVSITMPNCELSIFNASRVQSFLAAPVGKPGQSAIKEFFRKLLEHHEENFSPPPGRLTHCRQDLSGSQLKEERLG